eukprot:TRINITY_DN2469_c0_g1_i1.p1 TRINITY_DN2469_c0_g1~~TRINITY_DN2469_c0_g1_i1.p1  ORF type:complete len:188 (+),score=33.30 TRINITY_DN2469_c0_g1_i1:21-584(+)
MKPALPLILDKLSRLFSTSSPLLPKSFSNSQLQKATLFFSKNNQFSLSSSTIDSLKPPKTMEIALAGRSNVGKSTILNLLTGRKKKLARTSNTPGRTQTINFYSIHDEAFYLVDMPGYGYARASRSLSVAWNDLSYYYFLNRPNLRKVFLLVDSKAGMQVNDIDFMDFLEEHNLPHQVFEFSVCCDS